MRTQIIRNTVVKIKGASPDIGDKFAKSLTISKPNLVPKKITNEHMDYASAVLIIAITTLKDTSFTKLILRIKIIKKLRTPTPNPTIKAEKPFIRNITNPDWPMYSLKYVTRDNADIRKVPSDNNSIPITTATAINPKYFKILK